MNGEYLEHCLADCGFGEEQRKRYMSCSGDRLRMLYTQRSKLMDELHAAQRQVDVIDYLIQNVKSKEERL